MNFQRKSISDNTADALREKILSAPNTVFECAERIYVSQNGDSAGNGTAEAPYSFAEFCARSASLKSGTAVYFERNSVFRLTVPLQAVSGVSYGAYGCGSKPAFLGSAQNYAESGQWAVGYGENVWKIPFPVQNPRNEIGSIVFDGGKLVGTQRTSVDLLKKDGDFFHSTPFGVLYVYSSQGKPNEVFSDIEICAGIEIMTFSDCREVKIDNLCAKYCGRHALAGHNAERIAVTNCEIGWVGGTHLDAEERYGNGIEFYANAAHVSVENCFLYQIYDAALTFQMSGIGRFEDVVFRNNLIEYATYSIEFFNNDGRGNCGAYRSIVLENNVMRFAGYGWTATEGQRRYWCAVGHLVGWWAANEDTDSFVIRNNVLDCSAGNLVFWNWRRGMTQSNLSVSGNSFYQMPTDASCRGLRALPVNCAMNFGLNDGKDTVAQNAEELRQAISCFDNFPGEVRWAEAEND